MSRGNSPGKTEGCASGLRRCTPACQGGWGWGGVRPREKRSPGDLMRVVVRQHTFRAQSDLATFPLSDLLEQASSSGRD